VLFRSDESALETAVKNCLQKFGKVTTAIHNVEHMGYSLLSVPLLKR